MRSFSKALILALTFFLTVGSGHCLADGWARLDRSHESAVDSSANLRGLQGQASSVLYRLLPRGEVFTRTFYWKNKLGALEEKVLYATEESAPLNKILFRGERQSFASPDNTKCEASSKWRMPFDLEIVSSGGLDERQASEISSIKRELYRQPKSKFVFNSWYFEKAVPSPKLDTYSEALVGGRQSSLVVVPTVTISIKKAVEDSHDPLERLKNIFKNDTARSHDFEFTFDTYSFFSQVPGFFPQSLQNSRIQSVHPDATDGLRAESIINAIGKKLDQLTGCAPKFFEAEQDEKNSVLKVAVSRTSALEEGDYVAIIDKSKAPSNLVNSLAGGAMAIAKAISRDDSSVRLKVVVGEDFISEGNSRFYVMPIRW